MCVKYTLSIGVLFDFIVKNSPQSKKIYTGTATDASDKYEVCPRVHFKTRTKVSYRWIYSSLTPFNNWHQFVANKFHDVQQGIRIYKIMTKSGSMESWLKPTLLWSSWYWRSSSIEVDFCQDMYHDRYSNQCSSMSKPKYSLSQSIWQQSH